MKKQVSLLWVMVLLFSLRTFSQGNNVIKSIPDCKGLPTYFSQTKFVLHQPFGFSIAEKNVMGLSFVQFSIEGSREKIFRFPSWDIAGYLGAVVTDKRGNSYVVPRPFINTLNNIPAKQNTVYKVNSNDGTMRPFIVLSEKTLQNISTNPYGLMGLAYDCETNILYASSVFGSDLDNERGVIYAIQLSDDAKVIDKFIGIDAIGMGIAYISGKKMLFYGKARTSEIYQIELAKDGKFLTLPIRTLSLQGLGVRGDDKVREIRFNAQGEMLTSGINFNFNLANQDSATEHIYRFKYNGLTSRWELIGIEEGQQ